MLFLLNFDFCRKFEANFFVLFSKYFLRYKILALEMKWFIVLTKILYYEPSIMTQKYSPPILNQNCTLLHADLKHGPVNAIRMKIYVRKIFN